MEIGFFIMGDRKGIDKIKSIIYERDLGVVMGECSEVENIREKIALNKPNIFIGDLKEIEAEANFVGGIKEEHRSTLVVITSLKRRDMSFHYYEKGAEYVLLEPFNEKELVVVLEKVIEKFHLYRVIKHINETFLLLENIKQDKDLKEIKEAHIKEKTKLLLSYLGILGEAGSNDIIELIALLYKGEILEDRSKRYKVSHLYTRLNDYYQNQCGIYDSSKTAIEQRIRRAITKALRNMANVGLEDYSDHFFITYSTTFFDFKEIRIEMDYLKGKSPYRGKISIKKFMEGVMIFINQIL